MQSAKLNKKVFAPSSKAAQGFSSVFVSSQDGKWFAYVVKNSVVLRNMDNPIESKVFTKHSSETTAVAIHPNGELAVSSDVKGNILIWSIEKLTTSKEYQGMLTGKINGLQFSDDGDKLLIYGESKQIFAKVLLWESGTEIGNFSGVHKTLLAGCISNNNAVMVGGEECVTNLFVGFQPKCVNKEHAAQKFVTVIKSTPDGTKFVSTGFDKKLVIYDSSDGKVLGSIDTYKEKNGHKMTILGMAFLDNDRLVTASIDRTIKVWNLTEKKLLFTLIPKDSKKLDNSFILCGVVTNGKKIYACSLGGAIYSWNVDSLADNKLPDLILPGHQTYLASVAFVKSTKELITSDFNGTILLFSENGEPKLVVQKEKKIVKVCMSFDDSMIYALATNGEVYGYTKDKFEEKVKVVDIGGQGMGLAPSRKSNDLLFVLTKNCIAKVEKGAVSKKQKLSYDSSALEINEELGEVLIGDDKGHLHVLDFDLKEKSSINSFIFEISSIKLSPDGKLIAAANVHGSLIFYKADTKEKYSSELVFHNSKIFDLDWTQDSKFLISGSLDYSVNIADVETKKKYKFFQSINDKEINGVCFIGNNKDFACVGSACTLEIVTTE